MNGKKWIRLKLLKKIFCHPLRAKLRSILYDTYKKDRKIREDYSEFSESKTKKKCKVNSELLTLKNLNILHTGWKQAKLTTNTYKNA